MRAYNKLSGSGIKPGYLLLGFVLSSAIFSYMHAVSGVGPNNQMIVTASYLLAIPFLLNVYVLYNLTRQHSGSVFPKVLLIVNLLVLVLCFIRGSLAFNNPEYISSNGSRFGKPELMRGFVSAGPTEPVEGFWQSYRADNFSYKAFGDLVVITFVLVSETESNAGYGREEFYNSGVWSSLAVD